MQCAACCSWEPLKSIPHHLCAGPRRAGTAYTAHPLCTHAPLAGRKRGAACGTPPPLHPHAARGAGFAWPKRPAAARLAAGTQQPDGPLQCTAWQQLGALHAKVGAGAYTCPQPRSLCAPCIMYLTSSRGWLKASTCPACASSNTPLLARGGGATRPGPCRRLLPLPPLWRCWTPAGMRPCSPGALRMLCASIGCLFGVMGAPRQ